MVRGALVAAVALVAIAACGDSQLHTTTANVPLAAGTSACFDDIEIDQSTKTVYAADRADSGVDVFDVAGPQPRFLTTIKLPAAPNGLAVDVARDRVYAGTAAGTIEVIDAATRTLLPEIKTSAKDVDLLDFVAGQNLLLAGTGAGGTVLVIDTSAAGKVTATATIGKPVEQPRYDSSSGNVYATVPDLDALAVIDPKTGALKDTLKLGGCIPVGMAIRARTGTAVIACHKSVFAYDLRTHTSTNLGQRAGGGDVVQYFPDVDRFFVVAEHSAVPSVVGMFGGDPVAYIGSVNVDGGGNAVVYEETNDSVFTTDGQAGSAGLTSFQMDGTRPVPLWHTVAFVIGPFGVFLVLLMLLWWYIGRHSDPIHRKVREPRPEAHAG